MWSECNHLKQAPCTLDEHGEEDQEDSDKEEDDYGEKDGDEENVKLIKDDGGRSVVWILISGSHVKYLPFCYGDLFLLIPLSKRWQ